MGVYEFKGVNQNGQNVRGTVSAETENSARSKVKAGGVYIVSIRSKSSKNLNSSLLFNSKKVDIRTLSAMTRNLSTMIKSGIPLVDALDTIKQQMTHPGIVEILSQVKNSVNEGRSFHQSLELFPDVFNQTYRAMCKAGEVSGTLDIVLLRLAQFTEAQAQLKNKVRSALVYPGIMSVFSFFMIVFLLAYVVPKVRVLFEDASSQASIPWYSAVLLQLSDWLIQYWMTLSIAFVFAAALIWKWKSSSAGQKVWDQISIKLPVFGKLIRSVAIARFSRTLSTLLKGGVPVVEALDIVKHVVSHSLLYKIIEEAKLSIEKGEPLSASLIQSQFFPPMVTQMIRVGEKTGHLEQMLTQVSDAYDSQIKTDVDTMTALLEPAMLILMGGVIAFIVFSTLIPLLQVYNLEGITG